MVHLWHKHEAECEGCAEYNEHLDEHEGGVPLLLEDGRDGHAQHAHDDHVIEAHPHILGTHQWQIWHNSSPWVNILTRNPYLHNPRF